MGLKVIEKKCALGLFFLVSLQHEKDIGDSGGYGVLLVAVRGAGAA